MLELKLAECIEEVVDKETFYDLAKSNFVSEIKIEGFKKKLFEKFKSEEVVTVKNYYGSIYARLSYSKKINKNLFEIIGFKPKHEDWIYKYCAIYENSLVITPEGKRSINLFKEEGFLTDEMFEEFIEDLENFDTLAGEFIKKHNNYLDKMINKYINSEEFIKEVFKKAIYLEIEGITNRFIDRDEDIFEYAQPVKINK